MMAHTKLPRNTRISVLNILKQESKNQVNQSRHSNRSIHALALGRIDDDERMRRAIDEEKSVGAHCEKYSQWREVMMMHDDADEKRQWRPATTIRVSQHLNNQDPHT